MSQTLSVEDENKAKILYKRFQSKYLGMPNPTDINTKEKFNFLEQSLGKSIV